MYGNRIRQFQLIQQFVWIFHHSALIKFHSHHLREIVDLPDNSHVSVEYSRSFIHRQTVFCADFPL